jgi:hypothetical protein
MVSPKPQEPHFVGSNPSRGVRSKEILDFNAVISCLM